MLNGLLVGTAVAHLMLQLAGGAYMLYLARKVYCMGVQEAASRLIWHFKAIFDTAATEYLRLRQGVGKDAGTFSLEAN